MQLDSRVKHRTKVGDFGETLSIQILRTFHQPGTNAYIHLWYFNAPMVKCLKIMGKEIYKRMSGEESQSDPGILLPVFALELARPVHWNWSFYVLYSLSNMQIDNTIRTQLNVVFPLVKRRTKTFSSTIVFQSVNKVVFNSIVLFGPDLSISETQGFRINSKHTATLLCLSLANHKIAVSSLELLQLLWRICAGWPSQLLSNRSAVCWWHIWQWHGVGSVSSRTKIRTGMHCFKLAPALHEVDHT